MPKMTKEEREKIRKKHSGHYGRRKSTGEKYDVKKGKPSLFRHPKPGHVF